MTALQLLCLGYGTMALFLAWLILHAHEGHEIPGIGYRDGPEPFEPFDGFEQQLSAYERFALADWMGCDPGDDALGGLANRDTPAPTFSAPFHTAEVAND